MSVSCYSCLSLKFIPTISDDCFEGNLDIGEIVSGYLIRFDSIDYITHNINQQRTSSLTNRFVKFISENTRFIPSLSKSNPKKIEDLRNICLTLKGDYYEYRGLRNDKAFEGLNLDLIIDTVLDTLKSMCFVNLTDPISLKEIAEDDLFVSESGHRLSITTLASFHNTRVCRQNQGEQPGKKYIVNTYTKTFFSYTDSIDFVTAAVVAGKELVDLHPDAVVPVTDKSAPHEVEAVRSLRDAQQMAKIN